MTPALSLQSRAVKLDMKNNQKRSCDLYRSVKYV